MRQSFINHLRKRGILVSKIDANLNLIPLRKFDLILGLCLGTQ